MIAAFLTTVLFSLSAVFAHRTVRLLGGTETNFWRLVLAGALLAIYAFGWGGGLSSAAVLWFVVSGCIGFGLGDAIYFQALRRIGSRLSVMMVLCLSAPMAALVEWLWLGTGLSCAEILCALAVLLGVGLALAPREHLHLPRATLAAGTSFGIEAALCQAMGAVLSRKAFAVAQMEGENVDGITAAFQRILGGLVVMTLVLLLTKRRALAALLTEEGGWAGGNPPERRAAWRKALPWLLLTGLAGPALGVSCFQWALSTTPTGVVLPIVATTPLVILPFSRFFENDRFTWRSLGGGLLAVLGAVALAMSASHGR